MQADVILVVYNVENSAFLVARSGSTDAGKRAVAGNVEAVHVDTILIYLADNLLW